jgi:hypothetical protein
MPNDGIDIKALATLVTAAVTEADLRGKDYFTLEEACRFCGLGETAFREAVKTYNIPQGTSLGTTKPIFRKEDLRKAMEWHSFGNDESTGRVLAARLD